MPPDKDAEIARIVHSVRRRIAARPAISDKAFMTLTEVMSRDGEYLYGPGDVLIECADDALPVSVKVTNDAKGKAKRDNQ
jgi:hypothetical protein